MCKMYDFHFMRCSSINIGLAALALCLYFAVWPDSPVSSEMSSSRIDELEAQLKKNQFHLAAGLENTRDETENLILEALEKRPHSDTWLAQVLMVYSQDRFSLRTNKRNREESEALCLHSMDYLEKASEIFTSGREIQALTQSNPGFRSLRLAMAFMAVELGRLEYAENHAYGLLKNGVDTRAFDFGNIIHDAHMILGRIHLRRARKDLAVEHLMASSNTPGSPQLATFGPDLTLARELLRAGETEAVISYLSMCRSFWRSGEGRLERWIEEIRQGKNPVLDRSEK